MKLFLSSTVSLLIYQGVSKLLLSVTILSKKKIKNLPYSMDFIIRLYVIAQHQFKMLI